MSAAVAFAYEPEPELTGRELSILIVAATPGLRIERGEFRRDLPRLEQLGLIAPGKHNRDRYFLTERGFAAAKQMEGPRA